MRLSQTRTGPFLATSKCRLYSAHARVSGCLSGCLTKLVLLTVAGLAAAWALLVVLNPWALHIGGRSTPLLYWHGSGTVLAKDGKTYPLYVSFWPGRPQGIHGGGRREGKLVSAHLGGTGWLCIAPGQIQRLQLSGTMYGGYTTTQTACWTSACLSGESPSRSTRNTAASSTWLEPGTDRS